MNDQAAITSQVVTLLSALWWLLPLSVFLAFIKSAWFKGILGELLVSLILRMWFKSPDYTLFNDVMLLTNDGTTQIDHVLVSPFGIFVIETKNMKGWIFGQERDAYWTQQIFKRKCRFQNPLRQNFKHIQTLASHLEINPALIYSVIVFVGNASFRTSMSNNVMTISGLRRYISAFKVNVLDKDVLLGIKDGLKRSRLDNTFLNKRKHVTHAQQLKNNMEKKALRRGQRTTSR